MNKTIIAEAVIIIILVILICIVPNNSTAKLEDASLKTEHVGHLNQIQAADSSGANAPTGTPGSDPSNEDTTEKTQVSISRAKGGLAAYENGTFVEPEPTADTPDGADSDGNDNDGGSQGDGNDADTDKNDNNDDTDDGNSGSSDDGNGSDGSDDKEDNSGSDFEWPMKDPEKAIDSGKRATTTAPIKIRSTPTIQTEDNVIDTLDEGEVLVVTEASVTSTDPKVANWVEVYYKGKIGYISAKYVSIE